LTIIKHGVVECMSWFLERIGLCFLHGWIYGWPQILLSWVFSNFPTEPPALKLHNLNTFHGSHSALTPRVIPTYKFHHTTRFPGDINFQMLQIFTLLGSYLQY
jgi:hypothetical protein